MTILRTALRTFDWRQPGQQLRLFGGSILLALLVLGSVLALRVLRPPLPAQLRAGQQLAWHIADAIGHAPGVQLASGAYLPGETLLLYSRIDEPDRTRVRAWAIMQLEPFHEQLATMKKGEVLRWVIDFGPTTFEQEVLTAPLNRADDASLYRYVSGAPLRFTVADQAAAAPVTAPVATAVTSNTTTPVTAPTTAPALAASNVPTRTAALAAGALPAPLAFTFTDPVASAQPWRPLAGDWTITDGIYRQQRSSGYDFITMLNSEPQAHYRLEAQLRLVNGTMGGGFIYNAPQANNRHGAQVVDLDQQGGFLRWGHYDAQGNYIYAGGSKVTPAINDGNWHQLALLTHADKSTISLDGHMLGQLTNQSAAGYLGLITSQASVEFDDVTLTVLGPTTLTGTAAVAAPTATALSTRTFALRDDFANGNLNGWRVLNGTWQFTDESYQQLNVAGTDLGSISTFQGETYTVTVRMRYLDGAMGGGLYFNMAQRDDKMRSQMINYTRGGNAIQWGHFDEGGNFVFEDLAQVPNGADGEWHTLQVAVAQGKATFRLDGTTLATAAPLPFTSGYVGLLVSNSKVAFDDFTITTP